MTHTKKLIVPFLLLGIFVLLALPVSAGSTVVSINSGDSNSTFVIKNEPALVINGFDLSSQSFAFPITIDAVTINVVQPVAGQSVTVVVYEDPNGGTPQDAKVISRADVSILNTGSVRIALPQPVTTSSKIIWAGFYLPVDFKFSGDNSGTSVLTYWAWTPNGTFDIANLNSAGVFGPGDGSAPVGINMNGKARISIEFNQADGRTTGGTTVGGAVLGQQIVGDPNTSLSVMAPYDGCAGITYDPQDINIAAEGRFTLACRQEPAPMQPGIIGNIGEIPSSIPGFERRGITYQVFANGDYQATNTNASRMRVPVTHCITPNAGDLEKAVIGVAYGQPQAWYILPTMRYGNSICAELTDIGPVSYFVPRTGQETYLNADLLFSGSITLTPNKDSIVCNARISFDWNVKNDGFVATPVSIMRVTNVSVRTGQVTLIQDITLPSIPPGQTVQFKQNVFIAPNTYLNEANRLTFQMDPGGSFTEINESNNSITIDYILQDDKAGCIKK